MIVGDHHTNLYLVRGTLDRPNASYPFSNQNCPAAFTCSGASLLLSAEPSRRNGMKADARGGSARQTVAVTERKSHRDTNMTEWVRCPHNFSVSHTYPRASRYDDMLTISVTPKLGEGGSTPHLFARRFTGEVPASIPLRLGGRPGVSTWVAPGHPFSDDNTNAPEEICQLGSYRYSVDDTDSR